MSEYAVVLGSLNSDIVIRGERMPAKGESVIGASFNTFPGGKGANQAAQLARLGLETHMLGRVGGDAYGDQLIDSLREAGVRTEAIIRDPNDQTGIGCVFVDDAGDNSIVVIPQANMNWQRDDLPPLLDLIAGARVLLLQLEIPVTIVEMALRHAKAAGVTTVLNSAPARELPDELLAQVDLLVLNETECAYYLARAGDNPIDAIQRACELRKVGGDTVVITLGDQGAAAVSPAEAVHCPAYRVTAVDVTAAGDAFCGGLAYSRVAGMPLGAGLRFACACGALAATRPGAQPSLPTLSEVQQFMASKDSDNADQDHS